MSQPILDGCFHAGGEARRVVEAERAGRPVDLVALATQLLHRVHVVPRGDKALRQGGELRQPVARTPQVVLPKAGGEPEVVVLAHGLQDIATFPFGL
jgi:hypothetical protein